MRKLSLTIEQWNAICKEGVYSTVQIPLHGVSMQPLIRKEKDIVTVAPLTREIQKGDIVLFHRQDGAWVVHRVRACMGIQLQTIGDGCRLPDDPIRIEDVYGLIVKVRRGSLEIALDTVFWRNVGIVWMAMLPLRRIQMRIRSAVKNTGRKILSHEQKRN